MLFQSYCDRSRQNAAADFALTLKAATAAVDATPLSMLSGGGQAGALLDADGRQRREDAADQAKHFRGQVFTSVRPIAQRIAGQPIRLARIAPAVQGRQNRVVESRQYAERELHAFLLKHFGYRLKANEQLEVIDQHPVLDALHRPAPSIPGWSDWHMKYVSVASLEVTGYAYWWLPSVDGRKEIWFVPTHWLRPLCDGGKVFSSWALRPPGTADSLTLPADAVKPFWYPSPADPLRALGPLEAGIRNVLVDEFIIESQKRQFQQGFKPGAIVRAGSPLRGKDGTPITPRLRQWQYNQTVEALNARFRGMFHHGEPFILDAMIESIEPWGYKPVEMDYGGSQSGSQARVEQLFGTNPYIAGAASLGSRAEAAEADAQFCNNTINPKIELLSRGLTIMVLPEFDSTGRLVLFIEPCRPRDAEMLQKEWSDGLKCGAVTVNEYRSGVLRLPPVPGGDVAVLPSTSAYTPLPGDTPEDQATEDERAAEGDESAEDETRV